MPHRDVTCICGTIFPANPRAPNSRYCSHTCANDARVKRYREKSPPTGPLRYSPAEIDFIRAHYKRLGPKGCARALGRGWHGVQTKANLLGVRSNKWTHAEIQYVRDHYTQDGAVKVGAALDRKPHNVLTIARKHKVPSPAREKTPQPTIRARIIIARVASEWGLTTYDLLSSNKRAPVKFARWQVMRELRDRGYSLPKIGMCFGMDHSSAMNGLARWREMQAQQAAE